MLLGNSVISEGKILARNLISGKHRKLHNGNIYRLAYTMNLFPLIDAEWLAEHPKATPQVLRCQYAQDEHLQIIISIVTINKPLEIE